MLEVDLGREGRGVFERLGCGPVRDVPGQLPALSRDPALAIQPPAHHHSPAPGQQASYASVTTSREGREAVRPADSGLRYQINVAESLHSIICPS